MRIRPDVAFTACTLIWGTTWLAIKFGYSGLDPLWGASLRFLAAAAILLPVVFLLRIPLPKGRRQAGVAMFAGVGMFTIDYGLIYWAEQYLATGFTAVLFATMPLFVAIGSAILIPTERITPIQIFGIGLGLAGLCVIFLPDLRSGAGIQALLPSLAIVASAMAAAATSVVVRRWGRDLHPLGLNTTSMLVGGLLLATISLLIGERPGLPTTDASWVSLAYLVVFGSILSFFLYWSLLRQWPAQRAGLIPIATPVVAVVAGVLFNNEALTVVQGLGSVIVVLGVAVSLLPASSPTKTVVAAGK